MKKLICFYSTKQGHYIHAQDKEKPYILTRAMPRRRTVQRQKAQTAIIHLLSACLSSFTNFKRWTDDKAVRRLAAHVDSLLVPGKTAAHETIRKDLPEFDTDLALYRDKVEAWCKKQEQRVRDHDDALAKKRRQHLMHHGQHFVWEFRNDQRGWERFDRHSQWSIQDALTRGQTHVTIFANDACYRLDLDRQVQTRGNYGVQRQIRPSGKKLPKQWRDWQYVNDQGMPYVISQDKVLRESTSMYRTLLDATDPLRTIPKVHPLDPSRFNTLVAQVAEQFPYKAHFFGRVDEVSLPQENVNGIHLGMALQSFEPSHAQTSLVYQTYVDSVKAPARALGCRKWIRIVSPEPLEHFAHYARMHAKDGVQMHTTYHGSCTGVLGSIAKEGFNPFCCFKGNNLYGAGNYFAKDAGYCTSNGYCGEASTELGDEGDIVLIVCATLTTRQFEGSWGQHMLPICNDGVRADAFVSPDGSILATQNAGQGLPLGFLVLR